MDSFSERIPSKHPATLKYTKNAPKQNLRTRTYNKDLPNDRSLKTLLRLLGLLVSSSLRILNPLHIASIRLTLDAFSTPIPAM